MSDSDIPDVDERILDDLLASVEGDRAFVIDLIEAYLSDGAEQVAQVEAAIDAANLEALVRPAHSLKSSSATVGAARLAAMARELELAGREGRLDDGGARGMALRTAWEAGGSALRAWIARGAA